MSSVLGSNPSSEANRNQPPSAQASPPSITLSSPPSHPGFDSTDLEEPPPYTPNASITSGETTVEVGPTRPFQPTQPSPNPPRNGPSQVSHGRIVSSPPRLSSSSLPLHQRSASAVQQLSNSFNGIVNQLNATVNTLQSSSNNWGTGRALSTGPLNNWSSYPGQNPRAPPPPLSNPTPHNTHGLVPPPRHPQSPSASLYPPLPSTSTHSLPSMTSHSDFARDFYAAGSGSGENLVAETAFAPPPGPPPSTRQTPATPSVPNDGRPTSQPQPGHPLLKDGNLLVYPKGFECKRCHNVGYKAGNPQKPCNQCWKKYAKPFSGPLVYSFSDSSSLAPNFQKPLPLISSSAPSVASSSTSQPARLTRNNPSRQHTTTNYSQGGYNNPPTNPMYNRTPVSAPVGPPPNSVTYVAGDPRIGGTLCWKCGGQGNFELFIFRETCPLCSGIGRIFN